MLVEARVVSRPGDVWAIGPHRLICGDATDRDVVAALMQGEVSRLCFTSPPYGNQRDYTSGGIADWDGLMRGVFAHLPMNTAHLRTRMSAVRIGSFHHAR